MTNSRERIALAKLIADCPEGPQWEVSEEMQAAADRVLAAGYRRPADVRSLAESMWERAWSAIASVRDASPRLKNDADTDDIVQALVEAGLLPPARPPVTLICMRCHASHEFTAEENERLVYAMSADIATARCETDGGRLHAGEDAFSNFPCLQSMLEMADSPEGYAEVVSAHMEPRKTGRDLPITAPGPPDI